MSGPYARSMELFQEQLRLIPGGSQTNAKRPSAFAYGAYPIFVDHAEGCRVTDVDGNQFIDFVMGAGPIVLGYRYPEVDRAVEAQLRRGIIAGLLYPAEVEAARLLCELVPGAEMVRFLKGGAEATAAAARIARAYTGREVILNHGYRGWADVWAAAANSKGVPGCLTELTIEFPYNDLQAVEQLLDRHKDKVAAVVIGIMEEPAPGYLQGLAELAHNHGALFIIDEVITGFRLAPGGAQERYGVQADLACFAKAIANGMPVSAVAGKAEYMSLVADLMITVTYGGEALSLAAAVATMQTIRDRKVTDHLWSMGEQLMRRLEEAARAEEIGFACSGLAPIHRMQFTELQGEANTQAWLYMLQEMAADGVLLRRGGVNVITFSHTQADLDEVVEKAQVVFGRLRRLLHDDALAGQIRATPGY